MKDGVIESADIAFGGMAEIPRRARHCEQALSGQALSEQTIDTAMKALAKDYQPISDFRASADYRLQVSQNMLRRLHVELTAPQTATRVTQHA